MQGELHCKTAGTEQRNACQHLWKKRKLRRHRGHERSCPGQVQLDSFRRPWISACAVRARAARPARGEIVPRLPSESACQYQRFRSFRLHSITALDSFKTCQPSLLRILMGGRSSSRGCRLSARRASVLAARRPTCRQTFRNSSPFSRRSRKLTKTSIGATLLETQRNQLSPGSFSNDDLPTTPERTIDKCEAQSSSDSAKISQRFECDITSDVVESGTSFVGEDEVVEREKPEPEALTEADAVVRKGREFLQEKSAGNEDDLLEALKCAPSQAHLMPEGTLTALLNGGQDFECCIRTCTPSSTTRTLKTKTTTSAAAHPSSNAGLPPGHAWLLASTADPRTRWLVTADLGARARVSSSLSVSCESVGDGKDEEQ